MTAKNWLGNEEELTALLLARRQRITEAINRHEAEAANRRIIAERERRAAAMRMPVEDSTVRRFRRG